MRAGWIKRAARDLQPGDIVGSGERIVSVQRGLRTPTGKVEVVLSNGKRNRPALWNASTLIGVRESTDAS